MNVIWAVIWFVGLVAFMFALVVARQRAAESETKRLQRWDRDRWL